MTKGRRLLLGHGPGPHSHIPSGCTDVGADAAGVASTGGAASHRLFVRLRALRHWSPLLVIRGTRAAIVAPASPAAFATDPASASFPPTSCNAVRHDDLQLPHGVDLQIGAQLADTVKDV